MLKLIFLQSYGVQLFYLHLNRKPSSERSFQLKKQSFCFSDSFRILMQRRYEKVALIPKNLDDQTSYLYVSTGLVSPVSFLNQQIYTRGSLCNKIIIAFISAVGIIIVRKCPKLPIFSTYLDVQNHISHKPQALFFFHEGPKAIEIQFATKHYSEKLSIFCLPLIS